MEEIGCPPLPLPLPLPLFSSSHSLSIVLQVKNQPFPKSRTRKENPINIFEIFYITWIKIYNKRFMKKDMVFKIKMYVERKLFGGKMWVLEEKKLGEKPKRVDLWLVFMQRYQIHYFVGEENREEPIIWFWKYRRTMTLSIFLTLSVCVRRWQQQPQLDWHENLVGVWQTPTFFQESTERENEK